MLSAIAHSGNWRRQLALATADGGGRAGKREGACGVPRDDWYKKNVVLQWEGLTLSFAVAQDLFSSHAVDAGSRLLLKSLASVRFAERGHALDFGCGWGVLGLAWKARLPGWDVRLVDRDALAVEFSGWNAERLGLAARGGISWSVGLGPGESPPDGFDLILWNVPGKAGEAVLKLLAGDVADALGRNGLAALVIVNPLAAAVRAVYMGRTNLHLERDERFADHTILHIRKRSATEFVATRLGPFDKGVFDREPKAFDMPSGSYTLVPVVGLPEYESLGFDTVLLLSALDALTEHPKAVVIVGCGQGHLAVGAHLLYGVTKFTLVDRDLLALEATKRALAAVGVGEGTLQCLASSEIGMGEPDAPRVDTAIVRLVDQLPPAVMRTLVEDLEHRARKGGLTVVVGGGSTSVSRWLALVSRRTGWNARSRLKRRGASAATLSVRGQAGTS